MRMVDFISRIHRRIICIIAPSLSLLLSKITKIKTNKIVIDNFAGLGYGNNPKYIVEEMIKQQLHIDIVWLIDNSNVSLFPKNVRTVKLYSARAIYERCTAKIWIDNIRNLYPVKKKKNQLYLQVWHGPAGIKKSEGSSETVLSKKYIQCAKYDGSICNAIISNSNTQSELFKKYYWLSPNVEILEYGFPINDYIIKNRNDKSLINNLRSINGLNTNDYLIVYAPTFRDDGATDIYSLDYKRIINAFEQITKQCCKMIVKLHPNLRSHKVDSYNCENIINESSLQYCQDFQTLSLMTDCVISDYSSVIFDFLLQRKPIFIYTVDLEKYLQTRGLFLDHFYKLPCKINKTNDELINDILLFNDYDYQSKLCVYNSNFPNFDEGNASSKIVSWLKKHLVIC